MTSCDCQAMVVATAAFVLGACTESFTQTLLLLRTSTLSIHPAASIPVCPLFDLQAEDVEKFLKTQASEFEKKFNSYKSQQEMEKSQLQEGKKALEQKLDAGAQVVSWLHQ